MSENENAFKNMINPHVIKKIGDAFHQADTKFDKKRFQSLSTKLAPLELKQRVLLLTEGLGQELSANVGKDYKVLKKVLQSNKLSGFELWPISEYITQFGLDHFEEPS